MLHFSPIWSILAFAKGSAWGRGSVGRAMRSQRIGQGFESPRLHPEKKHLLS